MSRITTHMLEQVTTTHASRSGSRTINLGPSLVIQGETAVWATMTGTSECVAGRSFVRVEDAKVYANQIWGWL